VYSFFVPTVTTLEQQYLWTFVRPANAGAGTSISSGLGVVTWQELLGLLPVVLGVVHAVVGHPQGCALGHEQLATAEHEVVGVADAHLSQAYWGVHAEDLLRDAENDWLGDRGECEGETDKEGERDPHKQ
jgi:hypothetical protein